MRLPFPGDGRTFHAEESTMPPCLRIILVALVCIALGANGAHASQVRHLDTDELTQTSNDIVIGHVESTRSYWNAAHTKILTDVGVRIERSLKGGGGETLVLTQLGGEVDGVRTTVLGGPLFAPGEDVLLFVWRDPSGRGQVNGLSQGKFEIRRDAATGRQFVSRSLPGLGVRDARTLALQPSGAAPSHVPLDDMILEIQRAMTEAGR